MLHFSHALRPSSLLSTARSFTSSLFSRSPSPDKEDAAFFPPVEMEDPQLYTFCGPSPTQQFCAPLPRYHDYTAYAAPEPQSRFSSPSSPSSPSSDPSSSPASLFSAHPSPTSTAATSGGSPSSTSFAGAAEQEEEEEAAWYCPCPPQPPPPFSSSSSFSPFCSPTTSTSSPLLESAPHPRTPPSLQHPRPAPPLPPAHAHAPPPPPPVVLLLDTPRPTRPWSDLGPSTVAHLEALAAAPPRRRRCAGLEAPRARRGWEDKEGEGERVVRRLEEMVARWEGGAVGPNEVAEEEEEEEEEEEGWMEWA